MHSSYRKFSLHKYVWLHCVQLFFFFSLPSQVRKMSNFFSYFSVRKTVSIGQGGGGDVRNLGLLWMLKYVHSPIKRHAWRGHTLTVSNAHV